MAAYAKIKASTQDHLDLEDITEDLIILKTGWVALVLTTTAINFDILSEAEQDATIYAYGALLNSLSFPMEILIRSKKADITSYFQSLTEAERNQVNPDLKRQIQKYQDFIQSTVQQKTVLDKKFYLIITFSPLELGLKAVGTRRPTKAKSKAALIADAKIALTPKRDHLIKQLARLGLLARQLTTQELIELFYDIYNPAPLVEPAVEIPVTAPSGLVADAEPSLTRSETLRAGGLSSSSIQQPLPPKAQEPSTPIVENLRPVPPAFTDSNSTASGKSTPITSDQRSEISSVLTNQQSNIPPSQSAALKNLQEATAKAAGFINQSKITPTDVQPRPADGQIPSTTPTDNQGGTV